MSDKKSMKAVEKTRQQWLKEVGPRHFINMLDEMMAMQKRFGGKWINFDKLTFTGRQKWTKDLVLCVMDELSEVLGQINWKHWKKEIPIDPVEIRYELIDILHFLFDLMLLWGMTSEDVFSMYVAKNRENYRRQKGGY